MALKQITHGTPEYLQMVNLRDTILRQPLGLTFSHDELIKEVDDILIVCTEEDTVIGCCILTKEDETTSRLRQMAVPTKLHGRGIGASIINFAENLAKDKGYKNMCLHARDTAIGFYEKFGYSIIGESYMEVNIPHNTMHKKL